MELSCVTGFPTGVWMIRISVLVKVNGLNFKTNVEVVLFKSENLIKTI
jgi:hypothetical protein